MKNFIRIISLPTAVFLLVTGTYVLGMLVTAVIADGKESIGYVTTSYLPIILDCYLIGYLLLRMTRKP